MAPRRDADGWRRTRTRAVADMGWEGGAGGNVAGVGGRRGQPSQGPLDTGYGGARAGAGPGRRVALLDRDGVVIHPRLLPSRVSVWCSLSSSTWPPRETARFCLRARCRARVRAGVVAFVYRFLAERLPVDGARRPLGQLVLLLRSWGKKERLFL